MRPKAAQQLEIGKDYDVTASNQPTFIKVTNTLKRRAARGHGVSIEEMKNAADQVMADHTAMLREATLRAIAESREAIAAWKAGGDNAELVKKLASMALEAEDQGNVLGNPLLREVGTRLNTFMTLFAKLPATSTPNKKAIMAIELHLDAMLVAIEKGPHDAVEEASMVLLSNLELTQRTIG
jgi:hypothetical protein